MKFVYFLLYVIRIIVQCRTMINENYSIVSILVLMIIFH